MMRNLLRRTLVLSVSALGVSGLGLLLARPASAYQDAVFVYSNYNFASSSAMGDVLADDMDQGRGVVLTAFGFATIATYGITGKISAQGYLPFTLATYSSPGGGEPWSGRQ